MTSPLGTQFYEAHGESRLRIGAQNQPTQSWKRLALHLYVDSNLQSVFWEIAISIAIKGRSPADLVTKIHLKEVEQTSEKCGTVGRLNFVN